MCRSCLVLGTTVLVVMSTGCADSEKEEFEETSTTSSAFTVSSVYPADNATGGRYDAKNWDTARDPNEAARLTRRPAGWTTTDDD